MTNLLDSVFSWVLLVFGAVLLAFGVVLLASMFWVFVSSAGLKVDDEVTGGPYGKWEHVAQRRGYSMFLSLSGHKAALCYVGEYKSG